MNLALERYADNPIIEELVCWPPRARRMISIRAGNVLFRKPFVTLSNSILTQCMLISQLTILYE